MAGRRGGRDGRAGDGKSKIIEARRHALMILFGIELSGHTVELAVDRFYEMGEGGDLDPPPSYLEGAPAGYLVDPSVRALTEGLVRGVLAHKDEIDAEIRRRSKNWRIERMATLDRNVLRLGTYELLEAKVPRKVAINEAIELAKRYGAREASAFVNGILDHVQPRASQAG